MLTTRPKIQRVYATFRDPESGKSRTITLYETTPDAAADSYRDFLKTAGAKAEESPRRVRRQSSAA